MMTEDDEIIGPIRRKRESHAASFDYDLERIVQDLQKEEAESGVKIVTRAPRKPSAVPKQSSG